MSESRRRRIIKSAPSEGHPPGAPPMDDAPVFEDVAGHGGVDGLLNKKVYIPVPMILVGLIGIMVLSFSVTYLVTKWPAPSLDLPENQKIAVFKEVALPENLETRRAPEITAKPVEFPRADVDVAGYRIALPAARPLGSRAVERRYREALAKPARPPVARLEALERGKTPTGRRMSALIPGERLAGETFPQAKDIAPPRADLLIPSTRQPFEVAKNDAVSQKLMARRYAKAATGPEAAPGNNPLTVSATGAGLKEKTREFATALSAQGPVTDLDLGPVQAGTFAHTGRVTGRVAENGRSFSRARTADSPVAKLALPARGVPEAEGKREPLDLKLMARRYAKATAIPDQAPGAVLEDPPSRPVLEEAETAGGASLEAWRRYAAAVPPGIEGKGRIVIIIDDMGNNSRMSERLAELEGPLNFAFLPYAPNLKRQTSLVRASGHELLVHLPMEPTGDENPGPRALTTGLSDSELQETLDWNLSRFEGFVGINNHMGSRFTGDKRRMDIVMRTLKERGLLFLDSVTTNDSQGAGLARAYGIPWAGRDIFIDNVPEEGAIFTQLKKIERLAARRGIAIAIGHPHSATLKALEAWIPTLKAKNLVLVPLSSVVRQDGPRNLAGGQR